MKKIIYLFLLIIAGSSVIAQNSSEDYNNSASKSSKTKFQGGFGIKGGYNVAKLVGTAPDFKPDAKNGFMVAGFYSPSSGGGIGFRTELVFSRQGFAFDENGKTGSVTNDYIYLPQFTTFGIGKVAQILAGGQVGYLLKSSGSQKSASGDQDITSYMNKLDYGAAFGAEIYPFKGLVLGGRYNMSFGDTYKEKQFSSTMPNPLPFTASDVKGRNAVINFYIGYRF